MFHLPTLFSVFFVIIYIWFSIKYSGLVCLTVYYFFLCGDIGLKLALNHALLSYLNQNAK